MAEKVTANTPQEVRLLLLFRQVHREDCALLMDLVAMYAEQRPASKPHLSLVASEKRRSTDKEASA